MKRIFVLFSAFVFMAPAQDIAALRAQRDKLAEDGMHREALNFYKEKLLPVSDGKSGEDLGKAVKALRELDAWGEFDALVETAVEKQPGNSGVLSRAGEEYAAARHHGSLAEGEFKRGGEYVVNTEYRDKVRALQLFHAALAKEETAETRADVWVDIVNALGLHRATHNRANAWKLQTLTPLETLPAWDEPGPEGGTEGAPWKGGGPVLYGVPRSWESAGNDGGRIRFALAEIARLSEEMRPDTVEQWADFTRNQFGSQTLAGWMPDPEETKGILALDTLADDECLAKTSDGIRRFKLPPDQHFIALYRSVLKQRGSAGDSLANAYLNRLQYDKAVEVLRETIRLHGDKNQKRGNLLKQITGNWGRFGSVESVSKGSKAKLPLVFRNGKSVTLSAFPVDVEKLLADVAAHLKSNPKEVDWQRVQVEQIAGNLLEKGYAKYIGKSAGEWRMNLQPRKKHRETSTELELPVEQPGAWWVRAKMEDGNEFFTLAWIVDSVLLNRQVDGKMQWWLADAETGEPIPGADLSFLGYRQAFRKNPKPEERRWDILVKEFPGKTDENGRFLATPGQMESRFQWLAVAKKEGRVPAYFGFRSFYIGNKSESHDVRSSYGITDRPLYKAGDTVHLKFFLRPVGYGELEETKWADKTGTLTIFDGRGQESAKFENVKTDDLGAALHDFVLPKNPVLGQWRAVYEISDKSSALRSSAWVNFRVEEYRKPEYEVKVDAPAKPIALGGKFTAIVRADYFHGAPVKHAEVEVIVKRKTRSDRPFPAWRWDWLYGSGAWWLGVDASWHPGWSRWRCIPPNPPWWRGNRWTPEETVLRETMPIGEDGTVKVEVDTADAKQKHGDVDHVYSIEARVTDASRREETGSGSVIAARKPFEVIVWTDRGYVRPGDAVEATVSAISAGGEAVKKAEGTLRLYRIAKETDGKISEKEIRSWPLATDDEGRVSLKWEAPAAGQYRLSATLALEGGEAVEGAAILNSFGEKTDSRKWNFGPLEILTDKTSYAPGETAKLRVNSDRENASVWLFLRSGNATSKEARRVSLDGKSLEMDFPLTEEDQPNVFIEGITVHGGEVHTAVRQILLPPRSKAIEVTVEPAKKKVKPREESGLRVTLRDAEGKPLKGKFALTVYDKSLEAITGGSNVGPILKQFWDWKRSFSPGAGNSLPGSNGSYVKKGEKEMGSLNPFEMEGNEYPFSTRRSDPFSGWSSRKSSGLQMRAAAPAAGVSIEGIPADPFADGEVTTGLRSGDYAINRNSIDATLNNPGGANPILVRKNFADLVKWAGEIETDAEGAAEIPITWPDNLTTWKARVWTVLPGTRVGEGTTEVITTKELLVRMQTPRFLVERDEAVFSAIVHNDHAAAKTVKVSLELDGGEIDAPGNETREIEIPGGGETRVDWKVVAKTEGEATVRMKVIADDDSDAVEKTLPVIVHGMLRQDAWSRVVSGGETSAEIPVEVPDKLRPDQTKLTVRFSPSAATAVVDAIPYLASYPHGCTEQTLNRFVPTVIAGKMLRDLGINLDDVRTKRNNLNPQEIGDPATRAEQWKRWKENPVFDTGKLADMTRVGVDRLAAMQNSDGGWGWFSGYGEISWPHTTAVVVHGLLVAKANGAEVSQAMIDRGVSWLATYEKKQIAALQLHDEREALRKAGKKENEDKRYEKPRADSTDAFVRLVSGEAGRESGPMLAYLFRDRLELPVYARCLLGLELHRKGDPRRDEVIRQIFQFLKRDGENQTAYLELPNQSYRWFWYGSEMEANAWFLKLLSAAKPKDADTRGLVKYLVNNRKHGTYWNSTRDTAYAIEAIASYIKASGENAPDMEVKVSFDGRELRSVKITKENLFDFDGTIVLAGNEVPPGRHVVSLEKSGEGTLYANAYLEVFSLEDKLRAAGLEVKVRRKVWKLAALDKETETVDAKGLVVTQKGERFLREPLEDGAKVKSGERIEVELTLESKNDYEYLLFSDKKAAGFEAVDALGGYIRGDGGFSVYQEPRDQSVDFFLHTLPRGTHTIRYQLRAETPGVFKALPATAEAMYAPELRGNSEDIRLGVE